MRHLLRLRLAARAPYDRFNRLLHPRGENAVARGQMATASGHPAVNLQHDFHRLESALAQHGASEGDTISRKECRG